MRQLTELEILKAENELLYKEIRTLHRDASKAIDTIRSVMDHNDRLYADNRRLESALAEMRSAAKKRNRTLREFFS